MKLIFIITDTNSAYIEYEHTGVMPQIRKRAVNIELTDEQIKQIGIKQIGFSYGKPVLESIESVNLQLTPPTERK